MFSSFIIGPNRPMVLKGISPLISPSLLVALYSMGHGDEILFADAHFPAYSHNKQVIRADGLSITQLLDAILPLFELDSYTDAPVLMMAPVEGDKFDPQVEMGYKSVLAKYGAKYEIKKLERFEFYERAKKAYCIVVTGDVRKYANLILKKGVTPVDVQVYCFYSFLCSSDCKNCSLRCKSSFS
jgi:L-fucose mutarotase